MTQAIDRIETSPSVRVENLQLRDALASFPAGVTIVTAKGSDGRWWGFTASSFCAVSMSPPLVLVCLATDAECYPVFAAASEWLVHIISPEHTDLANRFATRGADKFGGAGFRLGPHGLPAFDGAMATLHCALYERHPAGDHTILVGEVQQTTVDLTQEAAVYFRRQFHRLA